VYEITEYLATHALGEKGTHPLSWLECETGWYYDGWYIYDVRYLSDLGEDNNLALYILTIRDIAFCLKHCKVVIGCGAGQSRSNAIAVGVLINDGMNYYDALELVKEKVPICHIDPSHLAAIRKLFNVGPP